MTDLTEIERRLSNPKAKGSIEELTALVWRYEQLARDSSDFRDRQKHWKRAAFFVGRAFDSCVLDAALLQRFVTIVRSAAAAHASPEDLRRLQSKLTAKWLNVSGMPAPKIVAQKKAKLFTHAALFVVADDAYFDDRAESSWQGAAAQIEATQHGRAVFACTNADGTYPVELRFVDTRAPLLDAKEYKKLTSSLEPVLFRSQSGNVCVGQPGASRAERVELRVPPGVYAVCVYAFQSESADKLVVVLAASEAAEASNPSFERVEDLIA